MATKTKQPKKLSDLTAFSISRRPQLWTKRKSCIVWARHKHITAPIAYISKPKNMPQHVFNEFMDSIQLSISLFPETENQLHQEKAQ